MATVVPQALQSDLSAKLPKLVRVEVAPWSTPEEPVYRVLCRVRGVVEEVYTGTESKVRHYFDLRPLALDGFTAVFNGHLNDADKRARAALTPQQRAFVERAERSGKGIMAIFQRKPTPALQRYVELVTAFVNETRAPRTQASEEVR